MVESWVPFATAGAETLRERGVVSTLRPLYFLHVSWARRTLTVSQAAILASQLREYESLDDSELHERFLNEAA